TQRPNVASTIPRFLATSATGCPEEITYCTASALYSSVNLRLVLPNVVSLKISVHCGHCLQDRERSRPLPAKHPIADHHATPRPAPSGIPTTTPSPQGYCVVGLLLVTASMRSFGRRLARLVARAMLGSPLLRWYPIEVLRSVAKTAGPLPVRAWWASSRSVTS